MSGTNGLIEALFDTNGNDLEKIAGPEAVAYLDELEKTAAAEGVDLAQFSDEDIVEMLTEIMGGGDGGEQVADAPGIDEGGEKVASAPGTDLPGGVDLEKVAAADYLGRVQAHAMADEFAGIFGMDLGSIEKTAGVEDLDQETFEKLAQMNANDVLSAVGVFDDPTFGDHFADVAAQTGEREKVASLSLTEDLSDMLGERTAEILDAAGWDVEAIAEVLQSEG